MKVGAQVTIELILAPVFVLLWYAIGRESPAK